MKDPLGVSPSKGNRGTTRGKEKILLTSVGIKPTTSGLDLPLLCGLSYEIGQRESGTIKVVSRGARQRESKGAYEWWNRESKPILGRYVGRLSVECRSTCCVIDRWSTLSVDMSVDTRPTPRPICCDRQSPAYQSTVGGIGVFG